MTTPPASKPDPEQLSEQPREPGVQNSAPYDPWLPSAEEEEIGFNEQLTTPTPVVKPVWRAWPLQHAPASSNPAGGSATPSDFVPLLVGAGAVVVLVSVLASVLLVSVFGNFLHVPASASVPTVRASATPRPTATATAKPTATPVLVTVATFVGEDTTVQGSWQGVYGSQGAVVVGDTQQLSPTIQVTPQGVSGFVWAPSTPDPRAPQKVSNPADRIAGVWYSSTSFTLDVNITDGQIYQVALYLLDWDQQVRAETITAFDPATRAIVDTRGISAFANGVYLIWHVHGHVVFQITNAPGSVNAVVNALFFSPA
ncbi:MAG TPA: hypothetical protein VGP82_22740 [Ktedonobacterales bacterium]|jgi:hypothetical protein|nr:hypothetical protein [Ktedonobacterales bacterium]